MKKLLLIIVIIIDWLYGFPQKTIIDVFDSAITGNTRIVMNDYNEEFIQLDSNAQMLGLLHLENYAQNDIMSNNIDNIKSLLEIYSLSRYAYIRKRAVVLLLDIYRLGSNDIISTRFHYDDYDTKAKKRIVDIIKDIPYNSTEKDIIYNSILNNYKKSISNGTNFLKKYESNSLLQRNELIDSLAESFTNEYYSKLSPCSQSKDNLLHLCAYLNIKEAESVIEKSSISNKLILLARLNPSTYQDAVIDSMYQNKSFDYYALAFIRSPKALQAMIDGLKVNDSFKYRISGFDKSGNLKDTLVDSPIIKKVNLYHLLSSNFIIPKPPFDIDITTLSSFDFQESLCDEVAKWMEENFEKLQINP